MFIGIDSSTTATKALLIDQNSQVIGVASSTYDYETPHPLWSEQSPELWWLATAESIRNLIQQTGVNPAEILGVGLTGQMHGLVLLDKNGKVLRPAILWNDQRTGAECDEIRDIVGKKQLIDITGNDALTGFTASKIMWVKNNEPEIYSQIDKILLPKDYVRYKLTGEFGMDKAGGAGTQLFDVRNRSWSSVLLDRLGIDQNWLPETFEGTEQTGGINQAASIVTGLPLNTPVYAGGGDQAASAVGTGAIKEGTVSLSLGTSGVVFASTDKPLIEPDGKLHAFCHAIPDKWHLMGVMLSAAGSMRWHHDTHALHADYDDFTAPSNAVPAGSDGLIFLPYLTGERTPHPDPLARGAFVGLTVRHTQAHMTRAVMEGVAFGFRDMFELMQGIGISDIKQVRVSGGGSKSQLWKQILADVLNAEMVTINTAEGAAYGAALLAAIGHGQFSSPADAIDQSINITSTTEPGKDVARYNDYYPVYRDLYPQLQASFTRLSQLESE